MRRDLKRLAICITVLIFGFLALSVLSSRVYLLLWKSIDFHIGRDTAFAWNEGEIQLLRGNSNNSYLLYVKNEIICDDIRTFREEESSIIFESKNGYYIIDLSNGEILFR